MKYIYIAVDSDYIGYWTQHILDFYHFVAEIVDELKKRGYKLGGMFTEYEVYDKRPIPNIIIEYDTAKEEAIQIAKLIKKKIMSELDIPESAITVIVF